MSFLDDLGGVLLAPVTGGASLLGMGGDEGLVGGLGNALFGEAGQIDPNAVHTPGAPDMRGLSTEQQRLSGAGRSLLTAGHQASMIQSTAPQTERVDPVTGARIHTGDLRQTRAGDIATRRQQSANIDRLAAAADGQVPSAAEIQQQQGVEAAIKGGLAIANSGGGGPAARAAAMRQAQGQAAATAASARQDAAALRANEQAAARQALVGATGQQRAGDLGVGGLQLDYATQQAGLQQQARLANQQADLQAALQDPQLALRSRQIDNARAGMLLGAGLNATESAASVAGAQQQLALQQEGMLTDRDLAIQGANVGAQNQRTGAMLGAAGAGLGLAFG